MQNVSPEWKENQLQTLRSESFVRLTLNLVDPATSQTAKITTNGNCPIADEPLQMLDDENKLHYATFEPNMFVLDGEANLPTRNTTTQSEIGFVSNDECDDDGVFNDPPTITIDVEEVLEKIQSLTIIFGEFIDEWATDFEIYVYNDSTLIYQDLVSDNDGHTYVSNHELTGFNRVVIKINKWNVANHRARVNKFYFGAIITFEKDQLLNFSIKQQVDVLNGSLPKYELSFEINNVDDIFNIDNPDGFYRFLIQRQKIEVELGYKIGDEIEYINGGIFYLSDWSTSQNNIGATFKGRELTYFLTDDYYKGLYSSSGKTLYTLLEEVLSDAEQYIEVRDREKWVISEKLKDYSSTAPLPVCSIAECIQLIAEAGQCTIFFDREGYLHIEPVNFTDNYEVQDYDISQFVAYEYPEITLNEVLKSIEVKVYNFYYDQSNQKLFEGEIGSLDTTLVELSSMGMVQSISGGTYSSANRWTYVVEVEPTTTSTITITGTEIKSSNYSYSRTTSKLSSGTDEVVSNQLITNRDMAEAVSYWVQSWRELRRDVEVECRIDPRLDALDIIRVQKKLGDNAYENVLITSVSYKYSGAFSGTAKGRSLE